MTQEQITLEKLYFFMKQKFEQIDQRFASIEHRLEILEGQTRIMQTQIESMNNRLLRLEEKFDVFQKDDKRQSRTFSKWILLGNTFLSATISFLITILTINSIN